MAEVSLRGWLLHILLFTACLGQISLAFTTVTERRSAFSSLCQDQSRRRRAVPTATSSLFLSSSTSGYVPPEDDRRSSAEASSTKPKLYPKAGDLVRFFDLDGGKQDGQVLVGRIRFVQKNLGAEGSGWTLELTEMEDVGDGYFADYGSQKRWSKGSTYRDLLQVAPLSSSFVRSENAYKVPTKQADGSLIVRAPQYDVEGYQGPFADGSISLDPAVVEADGVLYAALKGKLLKFAAIAGAAGTVIADLTQGTELAAIYAAGFVGSLLYLLFLSLKTDTLGTERAQFGKNVSNLRFGMPVLVVLGVALFNVSRGDVTLQEGNLFQTVTPSQFAAAMIGFLTYRLPLFFIQMQTAFQSDNDEEGEGGVLPGSAGVALSLLNKGEESSEATTPSAALATTQHTVFLISGPQATGRSKLVEQLVEQGDGTFVTPKFVDQVQDGAAFERLQKRGELLETKAGGRLGLTKQAVLEASADSLDTICVCDADVALAQQLAQIGELRLVGVWVGLSSVAAFEARLAQQVDEGTLPIDDGETKESTIRNKVREIVKEIEYGISCGIFEFTILNDAAADAEKSPLTQLLEASKYVRA